MKAHLLVFLVGVLHVLQINGQKTKSKQIMEAKIRRLESRLTDLEAKVDLLSDGNGGMTSIPERAAMEKMIQSLESDVINWKNQVNLLQITVDELVQQCNATEYKIGNVTITVGQFASEHEDVKQGGNDTLGVTDGLLTTASNATRQEEQMTVGRCNALFPNEPNRFPEVHEKDKYGWTPLHLAAKNSTFDVVCQLLQKGANPNVKDKYGDTPLHDSALSNSNVDVTRVLLEKGADPNVKNDNENTALHLAALSNSNVDVTRVLLEKGADPNLKKKNGKTSLHLAALSNSNADVTGVLLEKGADPNMRDNDGNTPLHLAGRANSNVEVTRVLLEKGADPNMTDNNGDTPLHLAVQYNSDAVLRVLLEKGADPNIKNNDGDTPLSLTSIDAIKSLLRNYGARS